jgi:hypothetical protein
VRKYDKRYFSISLNINEAKNLYLSPKDIEKLLKQYESFSLNDILKKKVNFLPELVLLKGKNGETAYVRNDSSYYEKHKYNIIFELPLRLKAQEQRNFVSFAYLLFKDKFLSDSEQVEQKQEFKNIVKKPFSESKHYYYDPRNPKDRSPTFKFRTKTFADSKPHDTFSKRSKILNKRNDWMLTKYSQYRKKGLSEYDAYDKIIEELKSLPKNYFGKWNFKKQNPYNLKVDAVQRIIQSKR